MTTRKIGLCLTCNQTKILKKIICKNPLAPMLKDRGYDYTKGECNNCYDKRRRREEPAFKHRQYLATSKFLFNQKKQLILKVGKKCVRCGNSELPFVCYVFHYRDGRGNTGKKFNVSSGEIMGKVIYYVPPDRVILEAIKKV